SARTSMTSGTPASMSITDCTETAMVSKTTLTARRRCEDQYMTSSGQRVVILLRGINVGRANRIAMADLRTCTEDAGCRHVTTVLASGNVIATDERPAAELRRALESAYSARFGYHSVVQVLPRDTLVAAVD